MTKYRILKLDGGHAFGLEGRAMTGVNVPIENVVFLDQYRFHQIDLSPFNVLSVTDFIDQEYLYRHRGLIETFLNQRKIVIANTHIFRAWLPGVGLFMPKKINHHSDYAFAPAHEDTFYKNIDMHELIYRKGVAGFYARGSHPAMNKNAEVVLRFSDGEPIVFIDRESTKGTVVAGACRDFLTYDTGDNSTKYITPQFLLWLNDELTRLNGENNEKNHCTIWWSCVPFCDLSHT